MVAAVKPIKKPISRNVLFCHFNLQKQICLSFYTNDNISKISPPYRECLKNSFIQNKSYNNHMSNLALARGCNTIPFVPFLQIYTLRRRIFCRLLGIIEI